VNAAVWAIRNNRTFTLLLAVVVLLGVWNYLTMPRLEDPEFTIRTAMVVTHFPGATPMDVERLVTERLEESIRELAEVEHVISQSRSQLSIIQVDIFERYMEMDPIWQDLRNKVDDTRPELPEGVLGPFVDDEFGDVFGIVVALTGDDFTYRELEDTAEDLRDELLLVQDVARVEIWGAQEEQIVIEFSNARLAELGVDPTLLVEALESQNAVAPAGSSRYGSERIVVQPTGEFTSIDEIRGMSLALPGQPRNIQLQDIAGVRRDYVDPPDVMTRFNGQRSLMIAVSMSEHGNITDLGQRMDQRLAEFERRLPVGLELSYLAYQPKFVEAAIDDFMINLYTAFGFVFLVMLLFTGFRTAIITGMLVPLAMLVSIAFMGPMDIALQRVSIASLIIALGILVDNGVVVSESILVRLSSGEERAQAVARTVSDLALPLLAASLTTIFAFLPIVLARTDVGEYTQSLFVVITLTLLASWALSMTFVPFMCNLLLKPARTEQTFSGFAYRTYRAFLLWFLRHKILSTLLVAALTAAAILAFRQVPEIFFPPNEREMFIVDFWQPYGTDITVTAERSARLEEFILSREGVVSVGAFIGSGGPRWYLPLDLEQDTPNYASLVVNTETVEDADRAIRATEEHLRNHLPDTRADVKRLAHGPPVGAPIQFRISGPEMDTLYRLRDEVSLELSRTSGVLDIWDDWGEWSKRLVIDVHQERARRAGISSLEIATSLRTHFTGIEISQFRHDDDLTPILVRSLEAGEDPLSRIADLNVHSFATGATIPLAQVATPRIEWQPSNMRRRDGERTMTVKATITVRYASEVLADVWPVLERMQRQEWAPEYRIEYGGEPEESERAQASIYAGLPLALGLIVLTLVAKFNSFRRFLIIALTVPPMIIGIVVGLHLTGDPFGFMALLGMISLAGIIINNSIILIGSIEDERRRGHTKENALVLASQQRLRPIVMTVTTTIMGLAPLSLRGGEMWSPLANVIIFGLFFSTILTLGLCPALYALFFRSDFSEYDYDPDLPKKSVRPERDSRADTDRAG
jgi:multidrug efflux pump subunit AcrB